MSYTVVTNPDEGVMVGVTPLQKQEPEPVSDPESEPPPVEEWITDRKLLALSASLDTISNTILAVSMDDTNYIPFAVINFIGIRFVLVYMLYNILFVIVCANDLVVVAFRGVIVLVCLKNLYRNLLNNRNTYGIQQ